jgi:hypothetical protein
VNFGGDGMAGDDREIRIDSAWKEEVRRERERLRQEEERRRREAEAKEKAGGGQSETDRYFMALTQSLAAQALMQLGQMENPMTGSRELDLQGARQTIEILGSLQRKTQGNLSAEEKEMLDGALHDLRMIYVERAGGAAGGGGGFGRGGAGGKPRRGR